MKNSKKMNKNDENLIILTAAQNNSFDVVIILIENNADVNSTDGYGRTALHFGI